MPPATKKRMYEPIWDALAKHKTVTVTVPKHLHKRVCKAVILEKWKHKEFNQKEGWRMYWLTYNIHDDEITFQLSYKLTEILSKDL
jgi:hypothetical protein